VAYKRRIYLIDPKFQLKFSLFMCILIFIASSVYPLAIYDIMANVIRIAARYSPEVAIKVESYQVSLITDLILWQIGFVGLSFIFCIFFSHKIAGPIYKAKKYLRERRAGHTSDQLHLRKGDYFHELEEEINNTILDLEEIHRQDFQYLGEVTSYLNNLSLIVPEDKKAVLNEITLKLSEIQNRHDSY